MMTGGRWGVCGSGAPRAARGTFLAHSRREKNTHFPGLSEGVSSERAKWHADDEMGGGEAVSRLDCSRIANRDALVSRSSRLKPRCGTNHSQNPRLFAIRFDRASQKWRFLASLARGCRALEANSRLALEARRGSLAVVGVSSLKAKCEAGYGPFRSHRRRVGTSRARASKRFARTPRCARLWRARRATSRRRARSRRASRGAACPGSGPRRARRSASRARRHPPLPTRRRPSARRGRRCT